MLHTRVAVAPLTAVGDLLARVGDARPRLGGTEQVGSGVAVGLCDSWQQTVFSSSGAGERWLLTKLTILQLVMPFCSPYQMRVRKDQFA